MSDVQVTRPDVACMWRSWEGGSSPPRPTKEHFAELLVPLWPYGSVGSDFWNRPSFHLHGQFRVPSSRAPLLPEARRCPTAAPPGACCDVTPLEGAGEWNWRERLFPGAQGHSYEPRETRRVEWKGGGGGGMVFKKGEPLGKELWSSGQVCVLARSLERIKPVISLCLLSWLLCRRPPPGHRGCSAQPWPRGGLAQGGLSPGSPRYTQSDGQRRRPAPLPDASLPGFSCLLLKTR